MKYLFIPFIVIVLVSCTTKRNKTSSSNRAELILENSESEGLKLFQQKCYACHSIISKSHNEIIAPPMVAVKRRYLMSYNTKKDFVQALTNWALDPKAENALMRGAVANFKVMPKQDFKREDIIKIAEYIFDHKIQQPEWFESHFNEAHPRGMGKGMGMGRRIQNN